MSQTKVVRLRFKGPLHLSDVRADYGSSNKLIHSDTFYTALQACLAMAGDLPEDGNIGVVNSSLFPFYHQANKLHYFFPKPYLEFTGLSEDTLLSNKGLAKKLKKISWISAPLFVELMQNKAMQVDWSQHAHWNAYFHDGASPIPELMLSSVRPRVTVPRKQDGQETTTIFYMDELRFIEGAGLFSLIQGNDFSLFEKALSILQEQGIGTDRSVGLGQFEAEIIDENPLAVLMNIQSDAFCALGLIAPKHEEELQQWTQSDKVRYELIERGGWITNVQGKRKLNQFYFKEGAIFSGNIHGVAPKGKPDINLAPQVEGVNHPIWRSGESLCIPVKLNNN